MITLNTPVSNSYPAATIDGFLERVMSYDVAEATILVTYTRIGPGNTQLDATALQACTPVPTATWEAMPQSTTRGKMIAVIVAYLGLANGTYTTS